RGQAGDEERRAAKTLIAGALEPWPDVAVCRTPAPARSLHVLYWTLYSNSHLGLRYAAPWLPDHIQTGLWTDLIAHAASSRGRMGAEAAAREGNS
ncbi:MAG TPA: hypothetical protein VNL71_18660, partial [Chloroflexota bacterium]|nr:hypothetical protein [Chloroflexota bacterium]